MCRYLHRVIFNLLGSLFFCPLCLYGAAAAPTEGEILFAKRVVELWKERDVDLVISQAERFFRAYPKSLFRDALLSLVAESYREKMAYREALDALNAIESETYREKSLLCRITTLYHLKKYEEVVWELEHELEGANKVDQLPLLSSQEQLYYLYYAAAIRELSINSATKEEKEALLQKAVDCYIALHNTAFHEQADSGLALTYGEMGLYRDGYKIYFSLAERFPNMRESYLYKAAKMQMHYDIEGAFSTLSKCLQKGAKGESELALLKVKLLYDKKEYATLLEKEKELKRSLKSGYSSIFDYYIAMSYFHVDEFEKAALHLKELADSGFDNISSTATQRSILLYLITALYQIDEEWEAEIRMRSLEQLFPQNDILAKAYHIKGLYLLRKSKREEALAIIEETIARFPNAEEIADIVYQRNAILLQLGHYSLAREKFLQFIEEFSGSSHLAAARKQLLLSAQNILKEAKEKGDPTEPLYLQLAGDMQPTIDAAKASSDPQLPLLLLQQMECYFEGGSFDELFSSANSFIERFPAEEQLYRAHLLIAQAEEKLNIDKRSIAKHYEKALELSSHLNNSPYYHILLFKIYLALVQDSKEQELFDRACEHLYTAYSLNPQAVPEKNRLWLANTYSKRGGNLILCPPLCEELSSEELDYFERCRNILKTTENLDSPAMLSLAKCHFIAGEKESALLALQEIGEVERLAGSERAGCHLLKAQLLQEKGDKRGALDQYSAIVKSRSLPHPINLFVQLNRARLSLELDENCQSALMELKRLQVDRSIKSEPIHLEAALDYCLFSGKDSPKGERERSTLNLLREVKISFTTVDDISSADYHAGKSEDPKKEKLYDSYMQFLDGAITLYEALSLPKKKERKSRLQIAKEMFNAIEASESNGASYLKRRIDELLTQVCDL